jgi:hypothetical protein
MQSVCLYASTGICKGHKLVEVTLFDSSFSVELERVMVCYSCQRRRFNCQFHPYRDHIPLDHPFQFELCECLLCHSFICVLCSDTIVNSLCLNCHREQTYLAISLCLQVHLPNVVASVIVDYLST